MTTESKDDVREALIAAIGYDPVKLSIRNHPEITYEYRTVEDRDGLVERILAAGFRPGGTVTVPGGEAAPRIDPNEVSAAWQWSDGRPLPTEIYIDSTMSQHMGDVFLSLTQGDTRLGVFLSEERWEEIDRAARFAIRHRQDLTEAGWT